ncbi:MAG: hypothetical protein DMF71_10385 [Acidobacteria bacterium]|nr:MAG: hypothetical protein DMF71_10385 [Acidobacteriota bacterium]
MKNKQVFLTLVLLVVGSGLFSAAATPNPSDESEVRGAVQRIFDQLKAGQYEALYDGLPSATRARLPRDRFINGLQHTRNLYQLDRIEIGAARVAGNLAVVDTVNAEGKLVVQQYLVREDGKWRVATGDRATIDRFLKSNPSFARKFPIKRPRAFIKQDDKWIEFNPRGQKS